MKKNILIFLLLICTAIGSGYAAKAPNLYSIQLPATSRYSSERSHLIAKAFQMVLVKVSGNTNVLKDPEIASQLKNAVQYVQEYSYVTLQKNFENVLMLQVSFNPLAVRHLLESDQQFIWGTQRPSVLVWAVIQKPNGLKMMTNDSQFKDLITQNALNRGIPVLFPALDVTDLQQITPNDIWVPFLSTVQTASKRYQSDAILLIRVESVDNNYINSRWILSTHDAQQIWQIKAQNLSELIHSGVDQLANYLAEQAENIDSLKSQVYLKIEHLGGMTDYTKILKWLRQLKDVLSVSVSNASPTAVNFQLTIKGTVPQLQDELSQMKFLQKKLDGFSNIPSQNQFTYIYGEQNEY